LADDAGHLEILFANAPYSGISRRVRLVAAPLVTGEEVREVNVPVLPCGFSSSLR
jgi:hypothetical protein